MGLRVFILYANKYPVRHDDNNPKNFTAVER